MTLADLITKFESYLLTEKRVSENTFIAYKQDLGQLLAFCEKNNIVLKKLNLNDLKLFLASLKKRGIAPRSQARKIATIKGLFAYGAARCDLEDYTQELHSPKLKKSLPAALSEAEIMQLFKIAEQDTTLIGKRNTAMLYLMYVTGMRVTELISLKITDVHRDTAVVLIEGK